MKVLNELQVRCKKIWGQVKYYLFNSISIERSIIFTLSMLFLFFVSYKIISRIYWKIAENFKSILMPEEYFFVFFCISALPIFVFLFFKFNILTNFWNKTEKPHLIDYLFLGVIILFLYFSFNHGDITVTSVNGKSLLDMVYRGMNIREFYDYNQGSAAYLLPQYILFGIWSIPVKIIYFISGINSIGVNDFGSIRGFTLYWYKLLPTLFYIGSAFMVYKIGLLLQMDKNNAKWISLIFLTFPMAVFSQFIFGQYDIIGVFFELLMINFFLQRKILKASLVCMIAITFKVFPIFIFMPLLLLNEKKVLKIFGYTIIAFIGYLFFNIIFLGSEMFSISNQFYNGMLQRLFSVGISTSFGIISFFILSFFAVCAFTYFINLKNKDELTVQKYILYIPLFVYSVFFSFVSYNPQWILVLVPYLVFNIFLNKNTKGMIFLAIGVNIGYLLTTMSIWFQNVDANLINYGIFPKIFGFFNSGENFKSLNKLVSFGGRIPSSLYLSLFVGMLIVNLIIAFPKKYNIWRSKNVIQSQFSVERDVVWINGLIAFFLFAIPSLLLFFSQGYKDVTLKEYISELKLMNNIEVLEKSVYDIVSVDVINNNIVLKCGTNDPYINIPIQKAIEQFEDSPFVEITYTNTEAGNLQIFYDYGSGFYEQNSSLRDIKVNHDETTIQIPITGWLNGKELFGLRIDPPNGAEFTIKNIKFISQKIVKVKR